MKEPKDGKIVFSLIDSAKEETYNYRFSEKVVYPWQTMIFSSEFDDLCYLDLLVVDEYQEPFK